EGREYCCWDGQRGVRLSGREPGLIISIIGRGGHDLQGGGGYVRLGGPVSGDGGDPEQWVAQVRRLGYRAAYCPVDSRADGGTVEAYAAAARAADLVIAEVGAWSNPISPDEATRRAAVARCQEQLALADRIGARCCVNIAGSRGERWDGAHPENFSEE